VGIQQLDTETTEGNAEVTEGLEYFDDGFLL